MSIHSPHIGAHAASHPGWEFRQESAIWLAGRAVAPNMAPYAAEMSLWLRREQQFISVCSEDDRTKPGALTNPYSYNASTHFGLISSTIAAAVAFVESDEAIPAFEAEARRLRLYNELVLLSARFCEAVIKQMLYCTAVPHQLYRNWSLGQLMAADCRECRKAGKPHPYSLLGALACQYFQCRVLDGCGFDHLALVNRRRNCEAAHASQSPMRVRSATKSRTDLGESLTEVCGDLEHIARHIGDIEQAMVKEIRLFIDWQPNLPPEDAFLAISAKPRTLER